MIRPVPVVHRHPRRNGIARLDPRTALSRGGRVSAPPKPPPVTARAVDPLPFRPLASEVHHLFAWSRGQAPKQLYDPRL